MTLSLRQFDLARHALGLPNDRRRSYRNRFYAGSGHQAYADWEAMIASGAARAEEAGGTRMFWLTEQGARAALLPGEQLCHEDFPASEPLAGRPPLFVPLRTEWFRAFESGEKTVEYRAYGPRWNETTCYVGRPVTLSHGYSGARLSTEIYIVEVLRAECAPDVARKIFPKADRIIAIYMSDVTPATAIRAKDTA